jgi:hypothetical protein
MDNKIVFLYQNDVNKNLIFKYFDCLDYSYFEHKNIKIEIIHWEDTQSILSLLDDKNILFLFVVELLVRFDDLDDKIQILNRFTIPVIYFDIKFPEIYKENNSYNTQLSKIEKTNIHCISDYAYDGSINLIGNPLLGMHNFEEHFFTGNNYNKYERDFISSTYDEFLNRKFDVVLKIGKPKNYIRNILLLLYIKHNIKNSFQCCSFSQEAGENINYTMPIDWYYKEINVENIINKFSLNSEYEKINFGTYLGTPHRINAIFGDKFKKNYIVDFNSYSEIYFESITSQPNCLKYKGLKSFTEKTFKIFYAYKLPLVVDTFDNINYLKNLGFEFFYEPCILEENDTIDVIYKKINNWLLILKTFDFKEEWNKQITDFNSSLHNNARLCKYLMKKTDYNSNFSKSIPTYLTTYQLFDLFYKNMLDDYINWDKQSYLFLKEKKLV